MSGLNHEEWRSIPGFASYQVSNLGRVQSFKRADLLNVKILRPSRARRGNQARRAIVTLYKDGNPHYRLVARLVCEAFHGNPAPNHQAAHLDGDAQNDRAENLAWKTPLQNCADRDLHNRTPRGENHYAAKLTAAEVRAIRARYAEVKSLGRAYGAVTAMAGEFGVALGCIEDIIYGRKWRHV